MDPITSAQSGVITEVQLQYQALAFPVLVQANPAAPDQPYHQPEIPRQPQRVGWALPTLFFTPAHEASEGSAQGWRTVVPDWIARVSRPVATSAMAFVHSPDAIQIDWSRPASEPVRLLTQPTPAGLAWTFTPQAAAAPDIPWLEHQYPRLPIHRTVSPAFFWSSFTPPVPTMAWLNLPEPVRPISKHAGLSQVLAWNTDTPPESLNFSWVHHYYPDMVLGPTRLGAQFQPYYGGASFPNDNRESAGRLTVYPAKVWPKDGLHASRQQVFASDRITFVSAPELAWKPTYPDWLRPVRRTPTQAVAFNPLTGLPAEPGLRYPTYPDWIPRRRAVIQGALVPSLFPTTVVTFGWKPVFPALTWGRPRRPWLLEASVRGSSTVPTLVSGWQAKYPDLLLPPLRIILEASRFDPEPIPNPPSPDLAWGPRYPDWLPLPPRAPWFNPFAGDPRVMPPSPDLSWQGRYPDWIPSRALPASAMQALAFARPIIAPDIELRWFVAHQMPRAVVRRPQGGMVLVPEPAVSPIIWRPTYPDRLRPAHRVWLAPHSAMPYGALSAIALTGWRPRYPDLLRAKARTPDIPALAAPVLVTPSFVCVEIDDEFSVPVEFAPEWSSTPTLADEFVIAPDLDNDGTC